jgi:hypothetical protein
MPHWTRGIAIVAIVGVAVLLSGCGWLGISANPPPPPGFASCAPTYPGLYLYPRFNACYPASGFYNLF